MICPNPNCKRIISPFDDKCLHCGTPLKDSSIKSYTSKADQIVKDAEVRAGELKEQIRSGFKSSGKTSFHNVSKGAEREKSFDEAARPQTDFKIQEESLDKKSTESYVDANIQTREKIIRKVQRVFDRTKIEIEEIKDEIFKCNPHITTNYIWQDKADKTILRVAWQDESINAGAGELKRKDVELTEGKKLYVIEINGGYVYFAYAVATAFVDFIPREGILWDEEQLVNVIKTAKDTPSSFGLNALIKVFKSSDISDSDMKSLGKCAFSLLSRTVGHELGHICYGHIHGEGYDNQSITTNHAGEFDADSFAFAIIGNSEDDEEKWLSLIMLSLSQIVIKILEGKDPFKGSDSHPAPIDRLNQAIFRFPEFSARYSINEKWAYQKVVELITQAKI